MKNRKLRSFFTVGFYGKLILKEETPISILNENIDSLRIFSRFNRLMVVKESKRKALTRFAVPMTNNIGEYCGFYWSKNK